MNIINKINVLIIFTLIVGNGSAQSIDIDEANLLRRMVMQSDVIFASSRYQTIDWFISQNDYPDDNLIEFYRQKKLIGDTLILSDEQLQKAKIGFLERNEKLLPFIKDKFPLEIKKYYLSELRKLSKTGTGYYGFYDIVSRMYDFDYYSANYVMLNLLSSYNLDEYEKEMKRK